LPGRGRPPVELSQFAFLVGWWHGEARVVGPDGRRRTFDASWAGYFILDGCAIADEYRMTDAAGEMLVLGVNLRAYDAAKRRWNLKWLNALEGTWVDLGPEELGGVRFEGGSISYVFREPVAEHPYTRATYENISRDGFTWRGERSDDGKSWSEFMVVELRRIPAEGRTPS
jgi:hypothetical protein